MTHKQGLMSVSQRAYIHLHNSTHIWGTVPDGIQTHMRAYIHVFAHIHPRTHTYHGYRTRAHTHSTHLSTARCLLVDTDIHTLTYTPTLIHAHACVHTHTRTHTHTTALTMITMVYVFSSGSFSFPLVFLLVSLIFRLDCHGRRIKEPSLAYVPPTPC